MTDRNHPRPTYASQQTLMPCSRLEDHHPFPSQTCDELLFVEDPVPQFSANSDVGTDNGSLTKPSGADSS